MSDTNLDASVVSEQRAWASPESLAFYHEHRCTPDDLYPSEQFFLPDVVRQVETIVDIGCAAGGFSAIMKAFNPRVRYTGVDVMPAFVEIARARYPDSEFLVGDGIHFSTPPGSFGLAHASGVLHLNLRFRDIIAAMWQQTTRFLLCDLRLTRGAGETGQMTSPFGEKNAQPLPYVVLQMEDALDLFRGLKPRPARVRVKGYRHRAANAAMLAKQDVIMAFFLAEKDAVEDAGPAFHIELDER